MQEPELEASDDVVKVEMGKPPAVKLVHAATGLTPRFENGAVNHVAGTPAAAVHVLVFCNIALSVFLIISFDAVISACWQAAGRGGTEAQRGRLLHEQPNVHGAHESNAVGRFQKLTA